MASAQGKHPASFRNTAPQTPPSTITGDIVETGTVEAMEEALPILPMGFVENTAEVYREVASFDTVPPEKLREYWRVYTITHKKLYDPTANRLENFWWHVWGSNRRELSGSTVARLYQEISNGPTFVPLRTPANRYDGPTIPNFEATLRPKSIPEPELVGTQFSQTKKKSEAVEDLTEPGVQRQVTASSSRPPPSQSILRKPRSSQSGPRPTPRFDLPTGRPVGDNGGGATNPTDVTEYDGSVVEEENNYTASASNDATTTSVGSEGGTSEKTSSHSKDGTPKPPASANSSKTVTSKQETRKPVKSKPAKKKFAVSASGASKKRPLISRRPVSHSSHGSQSSVGSEPGPSKPSQQPQNTQIAEEDEADDDLLPIDNMSASVSPANDRSFAESHQVYQQPLQTYQQSFVQTHTYRNSPLSDKAAGKQPSRPLYSSQMERTLSQASESTVVSSISGSTVASATAGTLPDAPLGSAASAIAGSLHLPPARLESSPVQASGSIVSSIGSSILDMPMVSRNFPVAERPIPSSGSLARPGGGLTRQSTMPYDRSSVQRQQIIRGGSTTSLASMRSPIRANPSSSALISQGSPAAPAMSTPPPLFAAPLMGRSISQDSYGSRPRPLRQYPSPKPEPMRSTTVAAPSMIAVSGQFMDPEGPDTFSFYSKTSLDDKEEEEEDGQELSSSFKGESSSSFSSSFQDPQVTQRPLFTPTRPTQTPRIPFARTRSQLNVILDREKERLGEGNYKSWNESRGGRDHDSQRRGS
ncbi:hypothetical protein F503_01216 [Ophiostoma piceae UAMH 11346]|uniref:Nitrogen regulatory protein areA GATA-like domain-containing protein n=1 Tax=Ophiostoma piceae (strain UAMH 11346) TaxID=1262450 RepID=S3CPE9_OPHP1|nr:hypothetical protein F503_01216 [Ophiostoma piceae UAMH 11346]